MKTLLSGFLISTVMSISRQHSNIKSMGNIFTNRLKIFVILLLSCFEYSKANISVSIEIDPSFLTPTADSEICVTDSTGVKYFAIIKNPILQFSLQNSGNYNILLSREGITHFGYDYMISCDTTFQIPPQDKTYNLDELVVVADNAPKITATGQIYKLSDKAKKSGNPYVALSEIPLLNVDISNQTVRTIEGDIPLVLIDGKYINSGIRPIDPRFIESVEITEVTNAKYLQLGVSKILNIKLKRNVSYYTYLEARTRHDIPIREGFGGANFEVGSRKFAISGSLFGDYLHHDKIKQSVTEFLDNNSKHRNINHFSNGHGLEGDIQMKWIPAKTEYFAAVVKGRLSKKKINADGTGMYDLSNYKSSQTNHDKDGGWLAGLFYEHTFKDGATFSSFEKYNRGVYDTDSRQAESITTDEILQTNDYWESSKSRRNQYTFTLDYNGADHKYGTIACGNNLQYTKDNDSNLATTPHDYAHVSTLSEYPYFTYSLSRKKFFMMLSMGMQYMRIATVSDRNSWFRPRAAASFTFALPHRQSIRMVYHLDNELPLSSQLQTFNTSTDPWLRIGGNAYLVPMEKHSAYIMHDKAFPKLNMRTFAGYDLNRNMIESFLKNDGDIVIQSYRNRGIYKDIYLGETMSYRIGENKDNCQYEIQLGEI